MSNTELKDKFIALYGASSEELKFVRAPGRVNLIGEHTDYNDGLVMPIALDKCIVAAVRKNSDSKIRFASTAIKDMAEVDISQEITIDEPAWANYCRGVVAGLIGFGNSPEQMSCDILFDSNIPHGAGLSSSAALEVATAIAIASACESVNIPEQMELAKLCQKAEHEFAGTPCGIMDQAIVVLGNENSALLIDCESGQTESINFGSDDTKLLVCDTQVKHELNDGGYALRRQQCERSAEILGVKSLRQAHSQKLSFEDKLNGDLLKRTRHVIGEIDRTIAAAEALKQNDLTKMGQLMNASHTSLRDDYSVSCEELDLIAACAQSCEGVYGARMTGGGFGGSAIVLVKSEFADATIEKISVEFEKKFSRRPPIFATSAAAGASTL